MKILADATLPGLKSAFPSPFEITLYFDQSQVKELIKDQEILLCRSTLQVDKQLVDNTPLRFVATASSGTDHINHEEIDILNIQILDAKGANASAVADYVLACFAYLYHYKQFRTKNVGIVGMGYVGQSVAHYYHQLGLNVLSYDPLKALLDPTFKSCSLDDLLECKLICIHANLHANRPYPSKHLLTEDELSKLTANAAIINAARGGIICEQALLNTKNAIYYCTDVFSNEPNINPKLIDFATLCTPHIAGHSIEAKDKAVALLSEKLHTYYQLPPPILTKKLKKTTFSLLENWPLQILSHYNPVVESDQLKQATNQLEAFLTLRKRHNFRHDFNFCFERKFESCIS